MKKKIRCVFFLFFLIHINYVFSATKLIIPETDTEQLNQEEKNKFKNIDYSSSTGIPNQYKGELKYKEGETEFILKKFRIFLGVGGKYTISQDTTLSALNFPSDIEFFSQKNLWKYERDYNYYYSIGLYWANGLRVEFEYSSSSVDTSNYGKNFAKYSNGVVFNQYLQKTGIITPYSGKYTITYPTGNVDYDYYYTTLTNNMNPLVELSIKTYMLNFVFERSYTATKVKPYIGFGAGIVSGSMKSLVNDGASKVPGAQVLFGLTYPILEDNLNLYLGFRYLFARKMEQTFTRILNVTEDTYEYNSKHGKKGYDYVDGIPVLVPPNIDPDIASKGIPFSSDGTYYNPIFYKSKEEFHYQSYSIDLGVRFFF